MVSWPMVKFRTTRIFAIAGYMEYLSFLQNRRFTDAEVAGKQKNRCKTCNFILGLGVENHQG